MDTRHKNLWTRILAVALLMLLAIMPLGSLAEGTESEPPAETETTAPPDETTSEPPADDATTAPQGSSEPTTIETLPPWTGEGPAVAYVNNPDPTDRLNLREEATTNSKALGRYFNGTAVEVLGLEGNFYQVRVGEQIGYMQGNFLTATRIDLDLGFWGLVNVETAGEKLHLRQTTEEGAISLGLFPIGTTVQILGETDTFYKVRTVDHEGYMARDFVAVDGQDIMQLTELTQGKVIPDTVELYAFPSAAAPQLGVFVKDEVVKILGVTGTWYYVEVTGPNGYEVEKQRGFMRSSDLTVGNYVDGMPLSSTTYAIVKMDNEPDRIALRASDNWSSELLGQYLNNTQVEVLDEVEPGGVKIPWWHVRVNGMEGYMLSQYLDLVRKTSPETWN